MAKWAIATGRGGGKGGGGESTVREHGGGIKRERVRESEKIIDIGMEG